MLIRYLKKAFLLGPKKTFEVCKNRSITIIFDTIARKNAIKKKAHTSWQTLKNENETKDFLDFFNKLKIKHLSFADNLLSDESIELIIKKADQATNNSFNLLGSGQQSFEKIPWHEDFRLKYQNAFSDYSFDKNSYFKDIVIKSGKTDRLEKDIKLPWELSRFQHLIYMGVAFQKTNNKKYTQAFENQITDWLDENPYLLGPNWVCPMDVGLRAVNWIIGFHFFKQADIDILFWQRFVCSLYDHMQYLENNWEMYDSITSNHYLSDLIGYFYLCWFFQDFKTTQPNIEWCYREILKECEKQVFDEGTDYESTTYYHKLVTELFYHFYLLAPELDFCLPASFHQKLKKMFTFLDWCTPYNGQLIQIGDNDSGKVVSGITENLIANMKEDSDSDGIKHFPAFGLSIVKTEKLHLSLRHHAYQKVQPSAHLHNDAGSITLAINGIDIFVDPGSYVYTPSATWRNKFRSVSAHNTFFIEGKEPVSLHNDRLFSLDIPENYPKINNSALLSTFHELYQHLGLRAHRTIEFDRQREVIITDWWEQRAAIDAELENEITVWNFTLHPAIALKKTDNGWLFLHEKQEIVQLTSSLFFEIIDGWYSPGYGVKVPCKQLRARSEMHYEPIEFYLNY